MKPVAFDYIAPETFADAVALLAEHGDDARPLAGGQSLMPMLALRLARPAVVVDLNRVGGLAHITCEGDEIVIGAMTRQAALLRSPLIRETLPLLAKALAEVGHPPTRTRGTIGGSLSHADPAAEIPTIMVALDARMVIAGPRSERAIAAADFLEGPLQTNLATGELLRAIRIPVPRANGAAFIELARRRGDFAIIETAVHLAIDANGTCAEACVVLGAVGPTPLRCEAVEAALTGRRLSPSLLAEAAKAVPTGQFVMHSHHASLDYRIRVAPVVVRRALETAARRAGAGAA